eukprot:m51a1_g14668 hypothetical protein (289) ;mRNA; f:29484-30692
MSTRGVKRPLERASDEAAVSEAVQKVYRVANDHTSLFFGADRDIAAVESEAKRQRRSPSRDPTPVAELISRTRPPDSEEQRTWSLGYGELTPGGFSKVLHYMMEGAPEALRMRRGSSFIDLGCGYGKAVFHTSVAAPFLSRCSGVECLKFRHARSVEVLKKLKDARALGAPVQLVWGDATKRDKYAHTHVFAFDYVFSDETQRALLPVIQRTRPKVFVSFSNPSRVHKLGGDKFVLLERLRCRTTGGQLLTGYAYTHQANAKHCAGLVPCRSPSPETDKENRENRENE